MLLALLLSAGSALLGGALALAARHRPALLELTRTFAFSAAAGVVALHLFPELLRDSGPRGLVWAALGFALPGLLEAGAKQLGPGLRERGLSGARVAAELGFVALFVHSLLEGLALRAAVGAPGPHVDLEIALVAHHAPLTAAVALPLLELLGARGAIVRVLWIAGAGVAGALLGGAGGAGDGTAFFSVAGGAMAGALLHVVADEIRPQLFTSAGGRLRDLAAGAAGIAVAGLGASMQPASGQTGAAVVGVLQQTSALLLLSSPALLAGDLAAAWLRLRAPTLRLDDQPGASPAALLVTGRLLGLAALPVRLLLAAAGPLADVLVARLWPRVTETATETADESVIESVADKDHETNTRSAALAALLDHLAECWPRRLAVLLLGGATLGALTGGVGFAQVPGGLPAVEVVLVIGGCSALSGAAGAALAVLALAAGAPALPALLSMVLLPALARLLLSSSAPASSGPLPRRLLLATLVTAGTLACYLALSATALGVSLTGAALAAVAPLSQPLLAQLWSSPVSAACTALLALPVLATLWHAGARGWLVPLRHRGAP